MGMNFSPMYQPVTTSTIKADGDLNVSPYDLIAYDGKFDTVEADEFVGGVGNFSSIEGLLSADINITSVSSGTVGEYARSNAARMFTLVDIGSGTTVTSTFTVSFSDSTSLVNKIFKPNIINYNTLQLTLSAYTADYTSNYTGSVYQHGELLGSISSPAYGSSNSVRVNLVDLSDITFKIVGSGAQARNSSMTLGQCIGYWSWA